MCLQFNCHGCGHIAYHRCFLALGPRCRYVDPRLCPNVERADEEDEQGRQCYQCVALQEASERLEVWIKTAGGIQLPTAGGSSDEDASSPGAGSRRNQRRQSRKALRELQQAETAEAQPGPAGRVGRPAADDDVADWKMADEHETPILTLHTRPLSGSTIASSSGAPTAIGSSAPASKRQSGIQPRDSPPMQSSLEASLQPRFEAYLPYGPPAMPRFINPSTPAHSPAHPSDENTPTRPRNRVPLEGQVTATNPNTSFTSTTNQPVEAGADTSDNFQTGGLKRTISTLSFDDLAPDTRTACLPGEATDVPPAYARPRSEVGLPPLQPGMNEDDDMEENGDEDDTAGGKALLDAGEGSFSWRRFTS